MTWSHWPIPSYIFFMANFHGKACDYPKTLTIAVPFSAGNKNSVKRTLMSFHQPSQPSFVIPAAYPLKKSQITFISTSYYKNYLHEELIMYLFVCILYVYHPLKIRRYLAHFYIFTFLKIQLWFQTLVLRVFELS